MSALYQKQSQPIADAREGEREFPFSEREYSYIVSLVYDRSGIVLGPNKFNMVYSRLARRLRQLQLRSFKSYCELLTGEAGDGEIGFLINAITTNLTRFFRETHHFEHLSRNVLAEIMQSNGSGKIRIWSAGCSSGEEPYSIAMTISQTIQDFKQWDVRILATDLDTNMVAIGKAGVYSSNAVSELPNAVRMKFFQRFANDKDSSWQIVEPTRKLITFKPLNLLGPWPMKGPFDAIFCRNVMIYFDTETKINLVKRYAQLLKPEGWLYIGHAESLLEDNAGFRLTGRTIYQKLPI